MSTADQRRALGALGERLAVQHLLANGYTIRDRNHRRREGEIDIVAEKAGVIAFVEVRCRRGDSMGTAAQSLSPAKQARLYALAEAYAAELAHDTEMRIDVIALDFAADGRLLSLDHIENAVSG